MAGADPLTDCIQENCYSKKSALCCLGYLIMLAVVSGLVIGLFVVPFRFGFVALPKYRDYMDEEQYHVMTVCSDIAIKDKGYIA